MKKIIASITCMAVLFLACEKKNTHTIGEEKDLELDQNDRALITAINNFTFKLFKEVKTEYDDKTNILLSPYSANIALSLVNNGAQGETQQAIKSALGYDGWELQDINTSQQKLIEGLPLVSAKNELSIANSVWMNEAYQILPSFLEISTNHYDARASSLPFTNPQAPDVINQWVKDNTKGKIDKIIDEVKQDDLMYVLNAIYFKGAWQEKFDKKLTSRETFHMKNGVKVLADFMKNTDNYRVLSGNGFKGVEIPYADEKFSMVLIKSDTQYGPYDLDLGAISELPKSQKTKVELIVPKFKFAFERELNEDLINMGMGIAFTDGADFSKIIDNQTARISKVKQKTFIEVNEEGTEAAAVTVVGMELTSMPQIQTIKFDSPFLFLIKENSSGLVLFVGLMNDPSAS